MHLNISSVKWQPFCQGGGGGGANWTTIKHAVWPSKCIFMFGLRLIFTSFIGTFYRWSQWHWIKYLNIIDVMVWFSLVAITWAKGNQYFICCYEATMNPSASAWSVLWNGDKGGVDWVNWLLFVTTYERYINSVRSLYWILFQTNETALVKVMTWHMTGSKTLREPVITQFTDPCTCMLHFA